jgi:glycosyltransferase involved in cell wall biosynthesis
MKIGIDAKWYFSGPISGRLLLQNVLPELFNLHPEIEWHIFLNAKEKNLSFPFRKENIKTHYIWAGFNMLSNLFVLPGYARHLDLDAVVFQTFSPSGKSFSSIAFIHDVLFHTHPKYFTWTERLYFKPLKWTAPKADRIITTTEYVKNELTRFGYAKNKEQITLAPSGVTGIFKPLHLHEQELLKKTKEKFCLPDSYLLFVGRLNVRKNIENLIRSLDLVADEKISLIIVGEESWKLPKLKNLLHAPQLRSRIQFTGPVTNDELACIYAMAKIFCFPSFAEGFGLPPLEAMASGIPVVVSNNTSIPEVCGEEALYVDPKDPKTIAEKINELLKDEHLYREKKQQGLERAKMFTWKKTAQAISKTIYEVIKKDSL